MSEEDNKRRKLFESTTGSMPIYDFPQAEEYATSYINMKRSYSLPAFEAWYKKYTTIDLVHTMIRMSDHSVYPVSLHKEIKGRRSVLSYIYVTCLSIPDCVFTISVEAVYDTSLTDTYNGEPNSSQCVIVCNFSASGTRTFATEVIEPAAAAPTTSTGTGSTSLESIAQESITQQQEEFSHAIEGLMAVRKQQQQQLLSASQPDKAMEGVQDEGSPLQDSSNATRTELLMPFRGPQPSPFPWHTSSSRSAASTTATVSRLPAPQQSAIPLLPPPPSTSSSSSSTAASAAALNITSVTVRNVDNLPIFMAAPNAKFRLGPMLPNGGIRFENIRNRLEFYVTKADNKIYKIRYLMNTI